MEFDRVNRWLTLAANLGLLVGLILVALQLNQNSELARAQLIHEGNITESQVWTQGKAGWAAAGQVPQLSHLFPQTPPPPPPAPAA